MLDLWFPPAPRLAILETISQASTRPPLFKHHSIADEAVAWTCREKERERDKVPTNYGYCSMKIGIS
jgi:hypothetical protein